MALVSAAWETEVGGCLEPGDQGCSEPRSCHCTPAWCQSEALSQKTKQTTHTHTHTRICENLSEVNKT